MQMAVGTFGCRSLPGVVERRSHTFAEFSLAPFSLESGSPWTRLIDLLVDAVVDEMMREAAGGLTPVTVPEVTAQAPYWPLNERKVKLAPDSVEAQR